MNIFRLEFRRNLRSVITWSISSALLIVLFVSLFSAFAVDAELLNQSLEQFPKELLMAFGMNDLDLASVLGYFSFVFLFCQLLLSIQAANYGFSILSIEERELTADFLLAKPVGRPRILVSKFLAALAGLSLTTVVVWITSFAAIELFRGQRPYEARSLAVLLAGVPVFQLVFLTLGMLISLLVRRVRSVTPYSMGLAFGLYVLNAFGGLLGEVKLERLTPFNHFAPQAILRSGSYDPIAWLSIGYIVAAASGAYFLYQKRNVPAPV